MMKEGDGELSDDELQHFTVMRTYGFGGLYKNWTRVVSSTCGLWNLKTGSICDSYFLGSIMSAVRSAPEVDNAAVSRSSIGWC